MSEIIPKQLQNILQSLNLFMALACGFTTGGAILEVCIVIWFMR
jgi:hypothetical protein